MCNAQNIKLHLPMKARTIAEALVSATGTLDQTGVHDVGTSAGERYGWAIEKDYLGNLIGVSYETYQDHAPERVVVFASVAEAEVYLNPPKKEAWRRRRPQFLVE